MKWSNRKQEYHKEYHAKWYQLNKTKQLEKRKQQRLEKQRFVEELKAKLCCSKCSEDDPCCLDFHHEDQSKKEFALYQAVSRNYSKSRILAEIKKCTVLCSNCHRKEHREKRGMKLTKTQI